MINTSTQRSVKNFGLNLYRIRQQRKMTRADLAEKVGLNDQRMIYDYENGIKFPSMERLIRLAIALDVTLDSMVQ